MVHMVRVNFVSTDQSSCNQQPTFQVKVSHYIVHASWGIFFFWANDREDPRKVFPSMNIVAGTFISSGI